MIRETLSNSYSWWRHALLGEFGSIYESDPQPGYYRMRRGKGGPWVPVAIWFEEGAYQPSCLVSGLDRDPFEVWTWCCRYPVSYEVYIAVAERGEAWPEDLPAELHAELQRLDQSAYGIGHNSSRITEAEAFLEEISIVLRSANEWLEALPEITSQIDADKAANYAERFSNLETRAEEARTAEKRPVLEEGRKIDAKWKPVVSKASDGKSRMKKALEPYLIAERDRRISKGSSDIEPPRAGTSGRRIGLRSRLVVALRDQEALNNHYRTDIRIWSDKAVKDLVLKITEADLLAGLSIPGASLTEEFTAA